MTYILWNNCHLTLNYVILLYMDVNRMRKNTEKRMKAYSIRYKMSKGIKDYHGWRKEIQYERR